MKSITASFSGDVDTAGLDCGAIAEEITSNFKLEVKETLKEFADKVEEVHEKLREASKTISNMSVAQEQEKMSSSSITYAEAVKSLTASTVMPNNSSLEVSASHDKGDQQPVKKDKTQGSKEGQWVLVENLRRRKIKSFVGDKRETSSLVGVEMRKKDTWDLYVGNLQEDVSESVIVSYLKENEIEVQSCYMLSSKIKGTKSARVRIVQKDKEKVLTPSFWPQHVRVRSWVMKPGWASGRGEVHHYSANDG